MTLRETIKSGQFAGWRFFLDARQRVSIDFSTNYAERFLTAGWPGHNAAQLIAAMTQITDQAFELIAEQEAEIERLKTENA